MYKILDDEIVYMVDGEIKGTVRFKIENGIADIVHTYVDGDLRGQGIASKLVEMAFKYLEDNNYEVKCSCSYAQKWAIKHGKTVSENL